MTFPTSRILPIKVEVYLESASRSIHQYDLVGIHSHSSKIEDFAAEVPNNAEVVTDYVHDSFGIPGSGSLTSASLREPEFRHHQRGLALIRKEAYSS